MLRLLLALGLSATAWGQNCGNADAEIENFVNCMFPANSDDIPPELLREATQCFQSNGCADPVAAYRSVQQCTGRVMRDQLDHLKNKVVQVIPQLEACTLDQGFPIPQKLLDIIGGQGNHMAHKMLRQVPALCNGDEQAGDAAVACVRAAASDFIAGKKNGMRGRWFRCFQDLRQSGCLMVAMQRKQMLCGCGQEVRSATEDSVRPALDQCAASAGLDSPLGGLSRLSRHICRGM